MYAPVQILMADGHLQRRERFILSCGLALGLGVTLVPQIATNNNLWPSYADKDSAAYIIQTSVMSILSSGFLITALTTILLNLILPYDQATVEKKAAIAMMTEGDMKQIMMCVPSSPLLPFSVDQCQRQGSTLCAQFCVPPSAVTVEMMPSSALEGEERGSLDDRDTEGRRPSCILRQETV